MKIWDDKNENNKKKRSKKPLKKRPYLCLQNTATYFHRCCRKHLHYSHTHTKWWRTHSYTQQSSDQVLNLRTS